MSKAVTAGMGSKIGIRSTDDDAVNTAVPVELSKYTAPNPFRLGYLIHDVSRMRRTLFNQRMKPEGITRSQWWVLANLARHDGNGVQSAQLAKELYVGKVTMGGLIDRLETAGYVFRRADKSDRRARHIFISPAGYTLIDRMRDITEHINDEICRGLTKQDISMMETHLAQLKHTLSEILDADTPPNEDFEEED